GGALQKCFHGCEPRQRPDSRKVTPAVATPAFERAAVTGQLAQKLPSTEHAALRRQAQKDLANGLKMDWPTLALLGPCVDVAQAALERVFVEDRGRAGRTVDSGDDVTRLVDRPGGRQPQPHVLLVQKLALSLGRLPHLGESLLDEGARRAQSCLAF